jgi:tetratricopeptide (TPR) repeat protein
MPASFIRDSRQAVEHAQREIDRGRLQEAIDLLQYAAGLDVDAAPVQTLLGVAYARGRQIERAFAHLERALALDPGGFAPRCALGELYLRLCMPEEGHVHLDLALAAASTPAERDYVHQLLREERTKDRRRVRRPSFRHPFWPPSAERSDDG